MNVHEVVLKKRITSPCNSHIFRLSMSLFMPEDDTSPFAETDSSIGEVPPASFIPPLYPHPHAEIVVEEEAAKRVVTECSQARGEASDEEKVDDVVGGV